MTYDVTMYGFFSVISFKTWMLDLTKMEYMLNTNDE